MTIDQFEPLDKNENSYPIVYPQSDGSGKIPAKTKNENFLVKLLAFH